MDVKMASGVRLAVKHVLNNVLAQYVITRLGNAHKAARQAFTGQIVLCHAQPTAVETNVFKTMEHAWNIS